MIIKQKAIFRSCILIRISMLVLVVACAACSNNGMYIINEEDDINEIEIIDGVKCSELGMIPNDETQGGKNRNILIDALRNGTNILVDDKYYLAGLGDSAPVDSDIVIVGITDNAEFSFNESSMTQSNFIKVQSSNFLMRKVKLTSMKNEPVYAFMLSGAHKMKTFAFEKCYFEGPIRLVSWGFSTNFLDPDVYDFGIDSFKFIDNICRNNSKMLLVLNDVIIKHSQVLRNDIRNFSQIVYTNAVSPGNNMMRKYSPKMEYLEVKNNKVINDDLWDGNELGADYVPTYHCFIFFEGNKCEYMNNHIEGLHIFDQHTLVYDSYLSCINLIYENNFWKNNILFETDENILTGRQLMKSKGAAYVNDSYKNIKRVYRNNEYIIEKSYATRLGRNPDELWVRIIEFDYDVESVVLENNKIDVYCIRLNSGDVKTHNYTFSNNDIHAVKTYNKKNNSVLSISILTKDNIPGNYIAENNKITIDEASEIAPGYNSLVSYTVSNGESAFANVVFKNNYVKWPDLNRIVFSGYNVVGGADGLNISVKNNTVMSDNKPTKTGGIQSGTIDLSGNNFSYTSGGTYNY